MTWLPALAVWLFLAAMFVGLVITLAVGHLDELDP